MSVETITYDEELPPKEQEASDYGLDEKRWLALSLESRVALGIAWLVSSDVIFENSTEITAALAESTDAEIQEIRHANRSLLQKGYLDRSGFLTGAALKLSLSEEGYKFIDEEIAKVQQANLLYSK